jgi:hypothetical protein
MVASASRWVSWTTPHPCGGARPCRRQRGRLPPCRSSLAHGIPRPGKAGKGAKGLCRSTVAVLRASRSLGALLGKGHPRTSQPPGVSCDRDETGPVQCLDAETVVSAGTSPETWIGWMSCGPLLLASVLLAHGNGSRSRTRPPSVAGGRAGRSADQTAQRRRARTMSTGWLRMA